MLSRTAQRGTSLLLGQLSAPANQLRCVGNATKLFPDVSGVQGDSYPNERGEVGQVSGMPVEMTSRKVSPSSAGHTLPTGHGLLVPAVLQADRSSAGALRLQCRKCSDAHLLQAYIFAPARTASQQGQSKTATLKAKGPAWKIEFEVQEK